MCFQSRVAFSLRGGLKTGGASPPPVSCQKQQQQQAPCLPKDPTKDLAAGGETQSQEESRSLAGSKAHPACRVLG